jgi:PAS domain S-box-containing protein
MEIDESRSVTGTACGRELATTTAIARVASAVAQHAGVSGLAEAVLDETVGALGAAACCFFVADSEKRELHLVGSRNLPHEVAELATTISFDSAGVASRAARARATQVVEDVRELADELPIFRQFMESIGTRSVVCTPLLASREIVGEITYVLTSPGTFSSDDLAVVEAIAPIVGIGLAHALTQDRLARESARLRTILNYAPHGIVYLDVREQRIMRNPAAERLVGPTTSSTDPLDEGAPLRLYRPGGSLIPVSEQPRQRARRGETISHEEVVVESSSGERRPMLVSATPIAGDDGRVDGVVINFEDITALKELERLREEFAAIVAHDLRNPISAIFLGAELLLAGSTADQIVVRRSDVERIRRSAGRLGEMVKDLLDASRIDIGRLSVDRRPVDAAQAVTSVVSRIQPTLGAHHIDVDSNATASCIAVDPLRFDQVLTNLLENAAKYSADGTAIVVRVREHERGVRISVADSGIGIAPDELPYLFDRFYQTKRARAMKKGFGLGLYITKGLVEAHGGHITVESELGSGTTFHVWLPLAPAGP